MLVELHDSQGQLFLVNTDDIGTVSWAQNGTSLNMVKTGKISVQETFETVVAILRNCENSISAT